MIISADIDGYITNGEHFWEQEPTPNIDVIGKLNHLYKKGHCIIYHTGRHPSYYEITYAWLMKHGCFFHAVRMGKLSADVYLDNKNGVIEDL